jgi:hypothetical protein
VLSIEPVEENLLKFANAVNLNNFHGKITVLRNVVSNTRGHLRLILPSGNNQGAARILTEKEYKLNTNAISISSIVLDDLTQFIHTRDVMIKIDVGKIQKELIYISRYIFKLCQMFQLYCMSLPCYNDKSNLLIGRSQYNKIENTYIKCKLSLTQPNIYILQILPIARLSLKY